MEKLNHVLERARLMYKHLRTIMVDIGEIEAIAEAFRALEQRAEAAEAERDRRIRDYKHLVEQHMPRTSDGCEEGWGRVIEARELQAKLDAAEAKLAEMEKQKPMAYRWESPVNGKICYDGIKPLGVISQPLYLHPAPAMNLAELVSDGWTNNRDADAALVMLDRIDTLDPADDGRIEDVKRIIRKMAASPKPSTD